MILMQNDMMRVHVRTTRVDQPGALPNYSYISSAAMQIGKDDVVEVAYDATILINGSPATGFDDEKESSAITFAGRYPLRKNVSGGPGMWTDITVNLLDGNWVRFHCNTKLRLMHVDVEGRFPSSEGLLGDPVELGHDRLLSRDKTVDLTDDWNAYGEAWQVKDTDPKLFVDQTRMPQHPMTCIYKQTSATSIAQSNLRRRLAEKQQKISLEAAKKACTKVHQSTFHRFCVQDVMTTGNLELANDSFYYFD